MEVVRAKNLGFCAGVKNAMNVLDSAYQKAIELNLPCYVYGDIVHNAHVVGALKERGIVKINSAEGVPCGVVVIRTHGITDSKRQEFESAGFVLIDATCPVVLRNQGLVRSSDKPVVIIGYPGHSEVVSLLGSGKNVAAVVSKPEELSHLDKNLCYNGVVQTTFSSSELEDILKQAESMGIVINTMNDICASSQLRRIGVRSLKNKVDTMLVVGDRKSANSNELVAVAKSCGMESFLVESADKIPAEVFSCVKIGLTAGASTPSFVYDEVEAVLRGDFDGRYK